MTLEREVVSRLPVLHRAEIQALHIHGGSPHHKKWESRKGASYERPFRGSALISVHSQERLDEISRQLNQRPRKTLGFETPAERFEACVATTD